MGDDSLAVKAALAIIAAWPLDDEGCSAAHIRQFAAYVSDHPKDLRALAGVSKLLAHKSPEDVKSYEFAIALYRIVGFPEGLADPAAL